MTFKQFRKIVQDYCKEFDFPFQRRRTYIYLWKIYKQDINANCHNDVSIDVAQFLDQHQGKLKEKMNTNYSVLFGCSTVSIPVSKPLDRVWVDCPKAAEPALRKCGWGKKICEQKQEKEVENTMTDYRNERNRLNERVMSVSYDKEQEIYNLFKMDADPTPRTYKDLIAAITGGKYKLDEKRTKYLDACIENALYFPGSALDGFIWEGEKPDTDGYAAAIKEMKKRRTAAIDAIMVLEPVEGLKALREFEAWMPEGKAS